MNSNKMRLISAAPEENADGGSGDDEFVGESDEDEGMLFLLWSFSTPSLPGFSMVRF